MIGKFGSCITDNAVENVKHDGTAQYRVICVKFAHTHFKVRTIEGLNNQNL